jgi:acetylornithine deacetylase/succinyl-diaminopimelate desuccinylase-like protein
MLAERKKRLAAKILLVCDTGMVGPGRPTATVGLRGITALEARFFGPSVDLHSGVFGGVVVNPLQALVSVLSQLHAPDGSVAVPGFYDGLDEPNAEERRLSNQSPIDLAQISQQLGVPLVGGEKRFTPLERRGLRPTLEFNGVGGGYQGKGGKTVIPAEAFAKLSMRLVAGQEPKKILELVQNFIASKAPEGVRAEFTSREAGGAALKLSTDSPVLSLARRVSQESFGEELACLWEGASIPIIPKLAEVAGAEPLLVGFGMDEDKIHSPNESFSLRQFEEGFKFVAALLRIV